MIIPDKKISFCGDVCTECPRYVATMANDTDALKKFAELWYRLGFRNEVVSPEDLKCTGCNRTMACSNGINNCEHLYGIDNCGECDHFPCDKIKAVFRKTEAAYANCRKVCSKEEFVMLKKAFMMKEQILTRIHKKYVRD
jgi:hypothetical protein